MLSEITRSLPGSRHTAAHNVFREDPGRTGEQRRERKWQQGNNVSQTLYCHSYSIPGSRHTTAHKAICEDPWRTVSTIKDAGSKILSPFNPVQRMEKGIAGSHYLFMATAIPMLRFTGTHPANSTMPLNNYKTIAHI